MNSHIRTASTKDCKTGCLRAKRDCKYISGIWFCFRVCITVSGSVCTIFIIIIITWQLCSEASYLQVVASVHLHFLAQVQTVLSSHGIPWSQSTEKCPMCSRNVCSNSQVSTQYSFADQLFSHVSEKVTLTSSTQHRHHNQHITICYSSGSHRLYRCCHLVNNNEYTHTLVLPCYSNKS